MQNKQETRSFFSPFRAVTTSWFYPLSRLQLANPKQTEWVSLQHKASHVETNTQRWLAYSVGNNFPLIGRLMWLVVEWLSLRGASLAIISLTLTMHRLMFFRLESAWEGPCSVWSRSGNMLVLLSTLWLACAVFRSQGTRKDSVIIFIRDISVSLRVFVHSSFHRRDSA